jgi:hypothetical protein
MVHMSCIFLTEKQMPHTFWYFAIKHATRMMNMIPGKYKGKLASPFMLVHGVRLDPRTWLPLFLLCYFHHNKDSNAPHSKNQAHTLDGIVIGRSSTSNALLVYNPQNQQYYEPDSYRLDSYHLLSLVYPSIVYDGGLIVSLHRDGSIPTSEPYPPGTRVTKTNPDTNVTLSGTVMDVPLDPTTTPHYLIQFDNGTTSSIPALKIQSLISKPKVDMLDSSHLLPPFLRLNLKITFEHEGQYHKGFLTQSSNGVYCFSYKSHINKKHPDWSIPLPNLTSNWHELCLEGVLVPGHTTHSFVCKSTANFVSAANLIWECPCSLLTALADKHPDCDIWMRSFWEEKDSIISMDTYDTITLAQYRALREKGAPRAIPTLCVLTIKPDEMMNPHRAKSCIVVHGNHKERIWLKSDKYAPVLRPNTMRLIVSMAVEQQRTLQQGNC